MRPDAEGTGVNGMIEAVRMPERAIRPLRAPIVAAA